MLGAIIGDLAGSIYEFEQIKNTHPVVINNIIEKDAFFSDDTILTIAILDSIVSKKDYALKLKEYGKKYESYLPNYKPYFSTSFSPGFMKWVDGDFVGSSMGNGAMMRVSPVGYLFDSKEEILENARLATIPSHNNEFAIYCSQIISLIIFYFRKGYTKEQVIGELNLKIQKPNIDKFNYTCEDTLGVCLYSLFNSSSFEDSIKLAISFGGDTDTNACIVGSMAEALYGIDADLVEMALNKLPKEFIELLKRVYPNINFNNKLNKSLL